MSDMRILEYLDCGLTRDGTFVTLIRTIRDDDIVERWELEMDRAIVDRGHRDAEEDIWAASIGLPAGAIEAARVSA